MEHRQQTSATAQTFLPAQGQFPVTRRLAKDPATAQRLSNALRTAADEVRARHVREWCARDDGAFPSRAAASREAVQELEVLCRALGGLHRITVADIEFGVRTMRPPREFDYGDDWFLP